MSYALEFDEKALKQFEKLDSTVANQFLNKLDKVLENPHTEKNRLRGQSTLPRYKIKLRTSGYRLVYEVNDNVVIITVLAVGHRDKIYSALSDM